MTALRAPRLLLKVALVALLLLIVGCSLPTDESAQVLTGPEIDDAMNPSTTSTTGPTGSVEVHNVYFFDEDILIPEAREVALNTEIAEILNLLGQGPVDEDLRSTVPDDFAVTTTQTDADGILTIVLENNSLFELGGSELGRAVAQIVITATQLEGREITGVLFEFDGALIPVPAGPELDNEDEPVDECDYRQFLADSRCAAISPTSSTSTTASTELVVPG